jgi:hypothetical protein
VCVCVCVCVSDCLEPQRGAWPRHPHSPARAGSFRQDRTKTGRPLQPHPSEVTIVDNSNWSEQGPPSGAVPPTQRSGSPRYIHPVIRQHGWHNTQLPLPNDTTTLSPDKHIRNSTAGTSHKCSYFNHTPTLSPDSFLQQHGWHNTQLQPLQRYIHTVTRQYHNNSTAGTTHNCSYYNDISLSIGMELKSITHMFSRPKIKSISYSTLRGTN